MRCLTDAQWLAALFPVGVAVSRERMREAMLEQRDDPRAMFCVWQLGIQDEEEEKLLRRAAEMGHAPAQAQLSNWCSEDENGFSWAQRAAAQGDRRGLYFLAFCYEHGEGCAQDKGRAMELYRTAAELGYSLAQDSYGLYAFGGLDWERYFWWGRAAARGFSGRRFCISVMSLLPTFEKGENSRILHTVGPVVKQGLDVTMCALFKQRFVSSELPKLLGVIELYEAMLERARSAVACWAIAGRRRGVVKDIRVMISKMAWEEAWRWGEKENVEREKRQRIVRSTEHQL
jgi:hypothetical protein